VKVIVGRSSGSRLVVCATGRVQVSKSGSNNDRLDKVWQEWRTTMGATFEQGSFEFAWASRVAHTGGCNLYWQ